MNRDMTEGTGASRSGSITPPSGHAEALELQFTAEVAATRASLRATKAALHEVLAEWQIEERTANALFDVAHELLTNALRYAETPIMLTVQATSTHLRVQVMDATPEPARMLPYRPGFSERGLGLRLVQQLSAQWGQQIREDGKTLWATFHRRRP